MCGIAGFVNLAPPRAARRDTLDRMVEAVRHRGPDDAGVYVQGALALGVRRLAIVDPERGSQPMFNEDGSVVLACNGEIFNHLELRRWLTGRGHAFRSECDVEVIVHLYEELGVELCERLEGQFAFALFDHHKQQLLLARDRFGITPLYFALTSRLLTFASEAKALLAHPDVPRAVDLVALDQILTFPGSVSPRTLFSGVQSLRPGHFLIQGAEGTREVRYWDLDYPALEAEPARVFAEDAALCQLESGLERAVERRLDARGTALYLSGGLDSSLVAALARRHAAREELVAFSVTFPGQKMDEGKYARLAAQALDLQYEEVRFDARTITSLLPRMIFHAERPVKESYNTCVLALSNAVRGADKKVALSGDGADELFAGYPSYLFDQLAERGTARGSAVESERALRLKLWGDQTFFYERDYATHRAAKMQIYSPALKAALAEHDCLDDVLIDHSMLRNRHVLHQRSYVDLKLRLADHLLGEHGDSMAFANGVETRYPFLDHAVVDMAKGLPPALKLNARGEKYALKRIAERYLPARLVQREKFGFWAATSRALLAAEPRLGELISPERIERDGYFDAGEVQLLAQRAALPDAGDHPHQGDDLLLVVLTFSLFLDTFRMPTLG